MHDTKSNNMTKAKTNSAFLTLSHAVNARSWENFRKCTPSITILVRAPAFVCLTHKP